MSTTKQKCLMVGVCCLAMGLAVMLLTETAWTEYILVTVMASMGLMALDMYRLDPANSHTLKTLLQQYFMFRVLDILAIIPLRRLEQACHRPKQAQLRVFSTIIERCQNTEYGADHNFRATQTLDEFRTLQRLTEYSDYIPYVEKILAGSPDILFPGLSSYVTITSGTSGKYKSFPKPKKVPLSYTADNILPLVAPFIKTPSLFKLKKVTGGYIQASIRTLDNGLTVGGASGRSRNMYLPFWSTPPPGMKIKTEFEAMYIHALFAIKEPEIISLQFMFAPQILTFFKIIEDNWEQLCKEIEVGSILTNLDIPVDILNGLQKYVSSDINRATELRTIFKDGFSGIAMRLWPKKKKVPTATLR